MGRQESDRFEEYFRKIVAKGHWSVELALVDPVLRPILVEAVDRLFTDSPKGLLIMGDIGVGKTSALAVIIYQYLKRFLKIYRIPQDHEIAQYMSLRFLTHSELIKELRNWNSNYEECFKSIVPDSLSRQRANILLLDDFGRGYDDKSGWNLALQDEYFDCRWRNLLPTFISTNLTPSELRTWQGWERIVDRIADPTWMSTFIISGQSRRVNRNLRKERKRKKSNSRKK